MDQCRLIAKYLLRVYAEIAFEARRRETTNRTPILLVLGPMAQNLAARERFFTDQEYLEFERNADGKHELVDGEILAMAGASYRHNLIGTNTTISLGSRLRGSECEIFANDMRVRMKKGCYGYPDLVVVCGRPQFADDEFDVLLNPILVVEILSEITRFRDKTEKLETYQKMESIREVLLVEQDYLRVEHYIKQTPMQWLVKIYEARDEAIALDSVECSLAVNEIYDRIDFSAPVEA